MIYIFLRFDENLLNFLPFYIHSILLLLTFSAFLSHLSLTFLFVFFFFIFCLSFNDISIYFLAATPVKRTSNFPHAIPSKKMMMMACLWNIFYGRVFHVNIWMINDKEIAGKSNTSESSKLRTTNQWFIDDWVLIKIRHSYVLCPNFIFPIQNKFVLFADEIE